MVVAAVLGLRSVVGTLMRVVTNGAGHRRQIVRAHALECVVQNRFAFQDGAVEHVAGVALTAGVDEESTLEKIGADDAVDARMFGFAPVFEVRMMLAVVATAAEAG